MKQKQSAGFILMETLIALMVMAIGMTALFSGFRTVLRAGRLASAHRIAVLHAENVMERLLVGEPLRSPQEFRRGQRVYRASWQEDRITPQIQRLRVTVQWLERSREQSISFERLLVDTTGTENNG